jgi:hypothetical protein
MLLVGAKVRKKIKNERNKGLKNEKKVGFSLFYCTFAADFRKLYIIIIEKNG